MTPKPGNLHDILFRSWFSAPEAAGLLFSEQMPERLFALFKPEPPELVPGSFIDDKLAEHCTDLLFRAPLKTGSSAYVYVLVEHKSSSKPLTPLQLLRYQCNIWSHLTKDTEKPPLTPIIPLVVYHGARPWSVAATFHGLFEDLDDAFRPLTVQFGYVLIDLGRIDDDKLSRDLRQRAHLTALKYNTRPNIREVGLPRLVGLLADLPPVDIKRIMRYILRQHEDLSQDDLDRALLKYAPERKDEIMNKFLQEIDEDFFRRGEAKGLAAGKAEGLAAGEAKGKAETLLKLLSLRFSKPSGDMEQRIREADAETLDRWTLRIFDAKSVEDVISH